MAKSKRYPRCFFGGFLKVRRAQKGLSQSTVAFDLGYASAQFISEVERGNRLLPITKIEPLAKILAVEVIELRRLIERDRRSLIKARQ